MLQPRSIPQVGAPDPELENSPIAEEEDEDTDVLLQQAPEESVCMFNGVRYNDGDFVASGSQVLKCCAGVWVESGE